MKQAVILAAGRGTRQRPLTLTQPKSLLQVGGTTIIEYTLETLSSLVDEIIIVINKGDERIPKKIGNKIGRVKIKYVSQEKPLGTGNALFQAKPFLKDKFLVLNGDDLYLSEDIKKVLKNFPSILVKEVKEASAFGVVFEKEGKMIQLVEKPQNTSHRLANTGLYFVDQSIFETVLKSSQRGELELTQAIDEFNRNKPLNVIQAQYWLPVSHPWDLLEANQFLLARKKRQIRGALIEKGATLKGLIVLEKGVVIKSGSYLEGPLWIGEGSQIGPNAYLKPATMIGRHCYVGANVEIENSIIGDNTQVHSLSFLGDSVIGRYCCLGNGTIMTNIRFDRRSIKVNVKDKIIDSHRVKLGSILGDKVKVGIQSSFMPGVFIDPEIEITPRTLVERNIKNQKFYNEEKN